MKESFHEFCASYFLIAIGNIFGIPGCAIRRDEKNKTQEQYLPFLLSQTCLDVKK